MPKENPKQRAERLALHQSYGEKRISEHPASKVEQLIPLNWKNLRDKERKAAAQLLHAA